MTDPLAAPAGLRIERWIDSLHEDANGLVWTTKAEIRAALEAAPRSPEQEAEAAMERVRQKWDSNPHSPETPEAGPTGLAAFMARPSVLDEPRAGHRVTPWDGHAAIEQLRRTHAEDALTWECIPANIAARLAFGPDADGLTPVPPASPETPEAGIDVERLALALTDRYGYSDADAAMEAAALALRLSEEARETPEGGS